MSYTPLPDDRYRQIHLDFHTSEHLPGVGSHFDPDEFADTLKRGHVDAINIFAKCHHSWSYYPTKVGMVHPNLKDGLDLFGEQLRICHENNVRVCAYYTVGWSATDAEMHPDWVVKNKDGSVHTNSDKYDFNAKPDTPKPEGGWKFLCPSGDYRELMLQQTQEILENYEVDGFWYDICNLETCYCDICLAAMAQQGIDIEDLDAVQKFTVDKWESFLTACRDKIRAYSPQATCFFNGLTHVVTPQRILDQETHYELEDLPTVWGGYDKLPPRARYFAPEGKSLIAMSGKFHTAWGEFGGYKHPDAIKYEAAAMCAYGAMCNFGDQLHPNGKLDEQTYRNIGEAFSYVEKVEPWLRGTKPKTNLGVMFSVEKYNGAVHGTGSSAHDEGICQMLMESQLDFERADAGGDLSKFDAVILTGKRCLNAETGKQLEEYAKSGGKVLILGESALVEGEDKLALDIGGEYQGPGRFDRDFTVAGEALQALGDLGQGPVLNYMPAVRIKPTTGETLAVIHEPYFSRTYGKYTSHQNTPYQNEPSEHAGAIKHGNILTLPHMHGDQYLAQGARQHRELVIAALKLLGFEPTVKIDGLLSSGRMAMYEQAGENRHVLHLLYGSPTPRGRTRVIEDLPAIHDVKVSVDVSGVTKARLPLTGEDLPVSSDGGRVSFTVPTVKCHALVELS